MVLADKFSFETGNLKGKAMKIAIGGPPHSGKSVLMNVLTGLLPREQFMIIEAAPDGEGITGWSHAGDSELVKKIRRKGKFTDVHVDWVVESLRHSTAPVTLVDLGGALLDEEGNFTPTGVRFTPENERILRECDRIIVIANPKYAEVADRWVDLAARLGVKPLAVLESVLVGTDEVAGGQPLRARISGLERENPPHESVTARVLAGRILEHATKTRDGSERADVNFPALAKELGLPHRNGGPDRDFPPKLLPHMWKAAVGHRRAVDPLRLWGNTPLGAPYHAMVCAADEVWYADPKVEGGYVRIPDSAPGGTGRPNLYWRVTEQEKYSLVEFTIPEQVFDVEDLSSVAPPEVSIFRGVILSGKAPRWLTGTLVRAYALRGAGGRIANQRLRQPWVAVFEPRESSRRMADGRTWAETNPGKAPAVVVYAVDVFQVGDVIPFDLGG